MILATKALQDKYDLICYYRDNLIASSGTVGDWLDAAHLPAFLGETLPERAQAWIAYKKQGIAWFDSSQRVLRLSILPSMVTTIHSKQSVFRHSSLLLMRLRVKHP